MRCLSITAFVFTKDTTDGTFWLLVAKSKMALLLLLAYMHVNAVSRIVAGCLQTKSTAVPDDREGLQQLFSYCTVTRMLSAVSVQRCASFKKCSTKFV